MLWFLRLSGWPIFIAIVIVVCLGGLALSLPLTWLGNRSVAQSAIIAVVAGAAIMVGLLGIFALATQFAFGK
jgi:hypothetical protein